MNAFFTYASRIFSYARAEATFYVPVRIHFSIGYWPFSGIKCIEGGPSQGIGSTGKKEKQSGGRNLRRNWDKALRVFLLAIHSNLYQRILLPHSALSKSGLKLVCNVNIVYENLKSENSQDYA
jgi:hypothetical protein